MADFPKSFQFNMSSLSMSYNPGYAVTYPVWAVPRSLATTCGITIVFSSWGYLDVSVPPVRLLYQDDMPSAYRVAPFGNLRIKSYVLIPAAYRSLSRPSSPFGAKVSPMRPYLIISIALRAISSILSFTNMSMNSFDTHSYQSGE
jgi:hypothetical protein